MTDQYRESRQQRPREGFGETGRGSQPTGGQTGAMGGQQAGGGSMRGGGNRSMGGGQQPMSGGQSMGGEMTGQRTGGQSMQGGRQPTGGGQMGQQPMEGGQMGQQPMGGGQMNQQSMGAGQMGQQPMGGQQTGQQMTGRAPSFEDHLTNELWILLEDFSEVTHVAEWCAKECAYAGPELATCARVCEDVAEIAELNEKLIARDSPFGPELAETFVRVATEGLPELRHHQQRHPHVAETVATIERTINSCSALLESQGGGRQGMTEQFGPTQQGGMRGGQGPGRY